MAGLIRPGAASCLDTERLHLRPPVHADADAICALANDWEVAKSLRRLPYPFERSDALYFVEQVVARELAWAMLRRDGGTIVGVIVLNPAGSFGKVELGYWLGRVYWGAGLATEAARSVLGFAFDACRLREIVSGCFAENHKSLRVLEKLGFSILGTSMQACAARGTVLPYLDMVLTQAVWSRQRA